MIGQELLRLHLIKLIEGNRLPKFLIIVGSQGSGKRTLANWIVETAKLDHEIVEDQKIDSIRSTIESMLTLRDRKLFIFPNAEKMNLNAQNAFLKTLEESPKNVHIIMTVNSLWNLLGTIKSRASVLTMEGYSRDELKEFVDFDEDAETLLDMCSTPGMILRYQKMKWQDMLFHCEKVVDNIGRISLANTFKILSAVDQENYDLIIPMLLYIYWKKVRTGAGVLKQVKVLYDAQMELQLSTVNSKNALETMFVKLWEVA